MMKKKLLSLLALPVTLPVLGAQQALAQSTDYCAPGAYDLDTPGDIVARVVAVDDATGLPSRIEYSQNNVLLPEGSVTPYSDLFMIGELKGVLGMLMPVRQTGYEQYGGYQVFAGGFTIPYLEEIYELAPGTLSPNDTFAINGQFVVTETPPDHVYPASETTCPVAPTAPVLRVTAPEFSTTADWQGGFTGTLTFDYIDPTPTGGSWSLVFDAPFEITQMWDGLYTSVNNGDGTYTYTVTNESWNGSLANGDTTVITFNANDVATNLLPIVELNLAIADKTVSDDWGSGFTGGVQFTYTGDLPIDEWYLSLGTTDFMPYESWVAVIDDPSPGPAANTVVFANETYNNRLEPGDSVDIGFNANGDSTGSFTDAALFGILDDPIGSTPPTGFSFQ